LEGTVQLPPSKSHAIRLLAFLIHGLREPIVIHFPSPFVGEDIQVFLQVLSQLQMIDQDSPFPTLRVKPIDWKAVEGKRFAIPIKLSGLAWRILPLVFAGLPATFDLYGDARLHERPIDAILNLLQLYEIPYHYKPGHFPFTIQGKPEHFHKVRRLVFQNMASSQPVTAALLVSPILPTSTEIEWSEGQPSLSFIQMTLGLLQQFGVEWERIGAARYRLVRNQPLPIPEYRVEADWVSGSYFFAWATTAQAQMDFPMLSTAALQPEVGILPFFQKMGIEMEERGDGIRITNPFPRSLNSFAFDFTLIPDLVQTFVALALLNPGQYTFHGVQTLPYKETDRLKAIEQICNLTGAQFIRESPSCFHLLVGKERVQPSSIPTYGDHRMAMSFSLLAQKFGQIQIENPQVVSKTFPHFWDALSQIGVPISWG